MSFDDTRFRLNLQRILVLSLILHWALEPTLIPLWRHATFIFVVCIWLRTLWTGKILLLWFTHWLYQRWIIVIPYSLGSPNVILKKVQSVLIRAARLIFNLLPRVPTTSSLIQLHWLPLKARIEFRICLFTLKDLKFNQPSYIREILFFFPSTLGLKSADDPYRLHEPRAVVLKLFGVITPRQCYDRLSLPLIPFPFSYVKLKEKIFEFLVLVHFIRKKIILL